ncbi:MAG TPA: hydroxymethylpyrimidine/phosphomethylpyrimidine kinase [Chitinophagales bacterium]|jgi:hydroxymethylpyrimidine/phosphomethylpyrimidine kinase|nr:hydroxymethylpyrimidine/phosphomethylpyrimidine kinase [Chitinophagales bacterium]HQG38432.1 hydroxymethylpyrimidine/phosphomethylpyrimidine kinase [Chitinophagales bacterium]
MTNNKRPFALSIAGYDPSAGAGVLADIKTFEAIGVYGLAATTCITYQNDHSFEGVHWLSEKKIQRQLYPILKEYKVDFVKIGLIENIEILHAIIQLLYVNNSAVKIIWDPILRASAGFNFHKKIPHKKIKNILKSIHFITPNWNEAAYLLNENDAIKSSEKLSEYCNVYLKGGHNIETPATDMLWINKKLDILHPKEITAFGKHGTGCVLSSALTAYLALGYSAAKAATFAKEYTYQFLISNAQNLGYHSTV